MVSPSWLEALREQLQQQALPPLYVERLLRELSDHFHDVQEEERGMDAEKVCNPDTRMGEPGDLARLIGGEYRTRYFSQRHPVVMFAVVPVLLLLGIWAGLALLALVVGSVFERAAASVAGGLTEQLLCYGSVWLPVALAAVTCCRAARQGRVDWRWPLVTAATLAVFPGTTVRLAPSTLTIGFLPPMTVAAFVQFMPPLAIGGWYSWRGHRLKRA
jgi:hypothetical protein